MDNDKFEWDGEQIKQVVKEQIVKHSPKNLLDGLGDVRHQVEQLEAQVLKSEENHKSICKNLQVSKERVKELASFEEKSIELQVEKLKFFISKIHDECKSKALSISKEAYDKDPSAYTKEHFQNMLYVNYQKLLATNKKVAEKISKHIIRDYLFDKPVFENPWKISKN